jgi:hypothetical protein
MINTNQKVVPEPQGDTQILNKPTWGHVCGGETRLWIRGW